MEQHLNQLTFLPGDSLVNLSRKQESERVQRITVTSGLKCLESFEKFDRAGSWAKMFSGLLIGRGDWYSNKCKLKWKLKGTKFKRLYFRLVPSALPIAGIGFGLLPTPTASDGTSGSVIGKNDKFYMTKGLPRKINQNGKDGSVGLGRLVKLLPTITAQDAENSFLPKSQINRDSIPGILLLNGITGRLNHRFVLEMMGYPPDWCDLQ